MQKRRQQIPDTWRALRASESTQFRTSISSIKKRRRKRAWKGIPHTSGWLSQLGHLCLVPVEWNSLVSMTRSCLHNPHTSYPFWEKWVIIKYDTDSERIQLNCVCVCVCVGAKLPPTFTINENNRAKSEMEEETLVWLPLISMKPIRYHFC